MLRGPSARKYSTTAAISTSRPGTVLVLGRSGHGAGLLTAGAKVVVRFFLDPPGVGETPRRTYEILYGILDRNIVGDLVLITRTQKDRMIPRNLLIQSAEADRRGDRGMATLPRAQPLVYAPRPDDPAELLGVVIYAMGPVK